MSDPMEIPFDTARVVKEVCHFRVYCMRWEYPVKPEISFVDENTVLGREENHWSACAVKAQDRLKVYRWKESWIGQNQEIRFRTVKALKRMQYLADYARRNRFRNTLDPEKEEYRPEAERTLYDLFKSKGKEQEGAAFTQAASVFGGDYEMIAALFYIKNRMAYLPACTEYVDESFALLGIGYRLTGSCTWENYCGYIRIVDRIRGIMQDLIPEIVIRLIDAYSFLWIVRQGLFNNLKMKPEEAAAIEQAAAAYMEKKAQDRSQP